MAERADEPESLGKRMQGLRGEARLTAIGEVVSQWRGSGRSQAAFCREVGIVTVTLGRWLRQLEAAKAPKSKDPVLVDLGVQEVAGDDAYEVVLADGLCGVVHDVLSMDPYSGHLFAFCDRRRTILKMLEWDRSGFFLFAKRLEQETYAWPDHEHEDNALRVTMKELMCILEGFDLRDARLRKRYTRVPA